MFAHYFGWSIEYILSLSTVQLMALQKGLIDLLNKVNGNDKESEWKKQVELSKLQLGLVSNKSNKADESKGELFRLGLADIARMEKKIR